MQFTHQFLLTAFPLLNLAFFLNMLVTNIAITATLLETAKEENQNIHELSVNFFENDWTQVLSSIHCTSQPC